MNLEELRAQIDLLDDELLEIITKRMKIAAQTRPFKEQIQDPQRESQIILRAGDRLPRFLADDFAQKLYGVIFAEARRLQTAAAPIVAVYPKLNDVEELLLRRSKPDWITVTVDNLDSFIEGIESGRFTYAMLRSELLATRDWEALTEKIGASALRIISKLLLSNKPSRGLTSDDISYFLLGLTSVEQTGDRCLIACSAPACDSASAIKLKSIFNDLGIDALIMNNYPSQIEKGRDLHLIDFSSALKDGIVGDVIQRLKLGGFNPHVLGRYSVELAPGVP